MTEGELSQRRHHLRMLYMTDKAYYIACGHMPSSRLLRTRFLANISDRGEYNK